MILNYNKQKNGSYSVLNNNGDLIGEFILDDDGYYYFYIPNVQTGIWASHVLREVADKLDELNKPWDDNINDYFKAYAP